MIAFPSIARQSLLVLLCGTALCVLGITTISNPKKSNLQPPTAFNFPQTVPLAGLSMLTSRSTAAHVFKNGKVATGMSYRYQHSPQPIEMEIRYITDGVANLPHLPTMIEEFTKIPPTAVLGPSTLKEQTGVGFYSLFIDRKTAYFSTCINPRGIATVTGDKFIGNTTPSLLSNRFQFDRVLPWLLGRQTLRDSRCLWTLISTPIDEAAPDDTMKALETVGINWTQWWQAHFPAA
jgi:cyanosortase A-associated protein